MIATSAFAALLYFTAPMAAMQTAPATAPAKDTRTAAKSGKGRSAADKQPTPKPSAQEIADAKAKGLVWVNLGTGVYHKDGEFYGNTKRGKFMTEDEATKANYHLAKEPGASKKSPMKSADKKPDKTS